MSRPRVFIRTRGGREHGWGHVVRSAAMAQWLRATHPNVRVSVFAEGDDDVHRYLADRVDDLIALHEDIDANAERAARDRRGRATLCVMDMLDMNAERQEMWRAAADRLLVIDELCANPHGADTVVCGQLLPDYPNIDRSTGARYLVGIEYFVIGPEFRDARAHRKAPQLPAEHLLIMVGGGVYHDAELKLARGIAPQADRWREITVVTGFGAPVEHARALGELLPGADVIRGTDDAAGFMASADMAVVSGGYSKYELACVGTPGLMFAVHEHQRDIAEVFAATGAAAYVGHIDDVEPAEIGRRVDRLRTNTYELDAMRHAGLALLDGRGMERIFEAVFDGQTV